MKIFITGASGWIGSAVTAELLERGHEVVGLARSEESATRLLAAGAQAHPGSLDDLDSLRSAAENADGVIHLGFKHDFSDYAASGRTERSVVEAFGDVLAGSDRPFLIAAGLAGLTPGRMATENDSSTHTAPDSPRGGSEHLALGFADRGIRAIATRFSPTVHATGGDHGFVSVLAQTAREKGFSGYVGDGANRWPAVHRSDAARVVALGVEGAPAGTRLHAVGEEGIPTREIAEALGASLGLPVASVDPAEATAHFGWIGAFFGADIPASSALTRQLLGWTPTGLTLLEDIAEGAYPGT